MTRIAAGLFLISSVIFAACGDGDATCAPGTAVQNGQCVAVGADTGTTQSDTAVGTDATVGTDVTVGPDVAGECTPEEAGVRDFGSACSKNCQCRTELAAYCYAGPFLSGFSFCTRDGGPSGQLNSDEYPTLRYNSACWNFPAAQWTSPMSKTCATMADCAALSDAYTNCGTFGLSWHNSGSPNETLCPNRPGSDDPSGFTIMSGKKICIISTLPPYDRR